VPKLINQSLAATIESPFDRPRPHDPVTIRLFASAALDRFSRYGLKPAQILQRLGDGLFDYEATASIFRGQALVRLSAERLWFGIENVRTKAEAEIALECGIGAVGCIEFPPDPMLTLQLNLHAAFASGDEANAYFSTWTKPEAGIVDGGCIAQITAPDLREPVRFVVERSFAYPNAAFISIGTRRTGAVTPAVVRTLVDGAGFALRKMALELTFP